MNNLPAESPTWLLLVVALVPAIVAWINTRRHGRDVAEIREQVSNSHETNLRDDIDGVKDALERFSASTQQTLDRIERENRRQSDDNNEIRRDIRGIREDVGELRGQVREDRDEFESFRRETIDFARRTHPDEGL